MKILSADELARTDAALRAANGNRKVASQALGLTMQALRQRINNNKKNLRPKWGERVDGDRLLTETETLDRVPLVPPVDTGDGTAGGQMSQQDQELAVQIESENRRLRRGLAEFGLSAREMRLATASNNFHQRHFKESVQIMTAGVTPLAIKYQCEVEDIRARLAFVRQHIATYGETNSEARQEWVAEEKSLVGQLVLVGDQLVRIMREAYRGNIMMALVRFRTKPRNPKPGYGMTSRIGNGEDAGEDGENDNG